jgi:YidC/Oxa1 family membrane protein insertase
MTQSPKPQVGNFALFMVLAFGVVLAHNFLFGRHQPLPEKPDQVAEAKPGEQKPGAKPDEQKPEVAQHEQPDRDPPDRDPAEEPSPHAELKPPKPDTPEPEAKPDENILEIPPGLVPKTNPRQRWITLGSADPASPYRMLVTLTDRGAAVTRIELNSPRYRTLTDENGYRADRSGYLGYLELGGSGVVRMVAPGTPAAKAGLKPGDVIESLAGKTIPGPKGLHDVLAKTKPGRTVELAIRRDGKPLTLSVTLGHRPMEVVRPENDDPLSFLMTLAQLGDDVLAKQEDAKDAEDGKNDKDGKKERPEEVDRELAGLNLRNGTWEVVEASPARATFRCKLPHRGVEITKTYRLAEVPDDAIDQVDYKAYHLLLDVTVRNVGQGARKVAYQLDGPTGLPIEGWWYAHKVGYAWSAGLRDVIVSFENRAPTMIACPTIADDDLPPPWQDESLTFLGVDAQYFSAVMIPQKENPGDIWLARSQPLRVGDVDPDRINVTDTSFRLSSLARDLGPGEAIEHRYMIFAGPKRPSLLAHYQLEDLVYYGWFEWFAVPMVMIVHFFHDIVGSYGLAIIMLTVLVRLCMFPMSKKQALGAQKMAELQPEIKKIQEKYKKDLEAKSKAQQELFRKHNYNPLSGCLVMFVQLPIFIGLYRGLMVDVELRGSPLLWQGIRWCSNLAAPDMLLDWHRFMPEFITSGVGMFGLGPYFNILPIVTVVLFLVQQKMFMPPPADEQQAMQQNIMKYMMLFMGILFFKVASGLCIYFIVSSLWGVVERKLLPKKPEAATKTAADKPPAKPAPRRASSGSNGSSAAKKKKKARGRK